MTIADIGVIAGAVTLMGGLAWFFFGPRRARQPQVRAGIQEVLVT